MKFRVSRFIWLRLPIKDFLSKFHSWEHTLEKPCPSWLSTAYGKWAYRNRLTGKMVEFMISQLSGQKTLPKFSIIIPIFNTPEKILRKTLQSVADQIYIPWEACIIDDSSDHSHVRVVLEEFAAGDSRFRIIYHMVNAGLSAALKKGISLSTGNYCVFLDHDDYLEPDALAQIAWAINRNPHVDFFYTDNDAIGIDDAPIFSQFKPDFSPELHHSMFYFNHLKVIRRKYLEKIGYSDTLRCSFDYDLTLRLLNDKGNIAHIPLILYHWRNTPRSLSKSTDICFSETISLLESSLSRSQISWARVILSEIGKRKKFGIFQTVPTSKFSEKVSIIITDRTDGRFVIPSIEALFTHTGHKNREILIIAQYERILPIRNLLSCRFPDCRFSYLFYNSSEQCNWSSLKNRAVQQAKGEFILFMDSELATESEQCLENLLLYGKYPGIGIVGGRIHDSSGKILEAGAVFSGIPHHPVLHLYQGSACDDSGYMNVLEAPKNYSMISGIFFFIKRAVFDLCGGFDAENFPDTFSDYDLCLKAVTKGFRVVSLPSVRLVVKTNKPGLSNRSAEVQSSIRFFERWKQYYEPYYNINLSREPGHSYQEAFQKNTRLILFPLHKRQTKVLSLSHEFRIGGAQQVKFLLDSSLHQKPDISVDVLCPAQDDGIIRQRYLEANIPVSLVGGYWNAPLEEYYRFLEQIKRIMKEGAYDVVYANTLNCFWGIEAAYELGIPTI